MINGKKAEIFNILSQQRIKSKEPGQLFNSYWHSIQLSKLLRAILSTFPINYCYSYGFYTKFTFLCGICSLLVEMFLQEWHQHHDGCSGKLLQITAFFKITPSSSVEMTRRLKRKAVERFCTDYDNRYQILLILPSSTCHHINIFARNSH